MAKKKDEKEVDGEQAKPKAKPKTKKAEVKAPKQYYEPRIWKGIKEVFRCLECNHYEDKKDDIIFHVVKHVPEAERLALLDKLLRS